MGSGKRPGTGELGVLGELAGKLSVDVLEALVEVGNGRAQRRDGRRIGPADGSEQALVLALAAGNKILALAHQVHERTFALREAGGHLRQRLGGVRLQRPLRKLEAFRARCGALGTGMMQNDGMAAQWLRVLFQLRLHQVVAFAGRGATTAPDEDRLGARKEGCGL